MHYLINWIVRRLNILSINKQIAIGKFQVRFKKNIFKLNNVVKFTRISELIKIKNYFHSAFYK